MAVVLGISIGGMDEDEMVLMVLMVLVKVSSGKSQRSKQTSNMTWGGLDLNQL